MPIAPHLSARERAILRGSRPGRAPANWALSIALLVVLTASHALAGGHDTNGTPDASAAVRAEALERHSVALGAELAHVQRNTRLYLGTWIAVNSSLAGAQIAVALNSESEVVRSNYLVGAGLSLAGLVMLASQPWPGLRVHSRYARLSPTDLHSTVAKVAYGEHLRAEQRYQDRLAIAPVRHVLAWLVALGSGVRAGVSFESVGQGVGRALFVLTVLELQLLTRPLIARNARKKTTTASPLVVVPWGDRHAQGASLRLSF